MEDKFVEWLKTKTPGEVLELREYLMKYSGVMGIVALHASLSARVFRRNGSMEDLGVVSVHAVTDAFVAQLVDTLQSSEATFSDYKHHDSGIGATAEDQTDTILDSACGDARTTGTQIEGATANIYKSVATHTYAGTYAIVEHGLFNDSTVGTLMDRSVLSAINVESGDKIEWTYQLTCTAGG